jgi:ribose transport system substrate-binding protein
MHMRGLRWLAVIGAVALVAWPGPTLAQMAPPTIGMVAGISTDAFYVTMHKGAEAAAAAFGVKLVWEGASEWSYAKQTPILNAMVARHVAAIIISPTDKTAMVPPIKAAAQAGIPVFETDTVANDGVHLSLVTSDNVDGGRKGADILAQLLGEKGEVAVINTIPGVSTTDDRQTGFLAEIKKYPNVKVVATQYDQDDKSKATSIVSSWLLAHPNLGGVFAANELSGDGASVAIADAHKGSTVKLVEYDAEPAQIRDLQRGVVQALIVQRPFAEGYLGVEYAYNYLQGWGSESFPRTVTLPAVVATKDNMGQDDVKRWFYSF